MSGVQLADLTWPEAKAWFDKGALVLVPIGAAAKEHGHHLPLKTDYLLARGLSEGVAAALPVVVAPIIGFGYYPAFRHYPGSQHLSPKTFGALVTEILEGFIAQGVRQLAILNTGVSTEPVVNVAVRELYERSGVRIAVAHIARLGKAADKLYEQKLGGHGDEHETSLILAIEPQAVRMELAKQDYGSALSAPKTVFYLPAIFDGDPDSGPDYSETGVRGDPMLASAEKGRRTLAAMVEELVAGLRKLYPEATAIQT